MPSHHFGAYGQPDCGYGESSRGVLDFRSACSRSSCLRCCFLYFQILNAMPNTTLITVPTIETTMPAIPPLLSLWPPPRSEEHTSELQSHSDLVCRLLLEKKKKKYNHKHEY